MPHNLPPHYTQLGGGNYFLLYEWGGRGVWLLKSESIREE